MGHKHTKPCAMTGCTAPAACALKINIPAMGVPIDMHKPIAMFVGLELCEADFDVINVQDFLGPQARFPLEAQLRAAGKAAPDYARAWATKVPLDDPEYLAFKRAAARR